MQVSSDVASITIRQRTDRPHHKRWVVRWREWGDDGALHQRSKTFQVKKAADKFFSRKRAELEGLLEPDETARPVTLREWYDDLRDGWHSLAAATVATRESVWRTHLLPTFGAKRLDRITTESVKRWQLALHEAGQRQQAARALHMLNGAMREAVRRGRIRRNPCQGVKAPKIVTSSPLELRDLSIEQVLALARATGTIQSQPACATGRLLVELEPDDASRVDTELRNRDGEPWPAILQRLQTELPRLRLPGRQSLRRHGIGDCQCTPGVPSTTSRHPQSRLIVLVAAFAGLRFSEIAGLRVTDLEDATLRIQRATVEVAGRQHDKQPKSKAGLRRVLLHEVLAKELKQHGADRPPTDRMFTSPTGGTLMRTNWQARFFRPARRSLGLNWLEFHDLRAWHGSILVAQGEHVKVIQGRLGHASASTTMDLYATQLVGLDARAAERLNVDIKAAGG